MRSATGIRLDKVCRMTRIWLIRHGEPEDYVRGRCYGSLDVALSNKGREQMRLAAAYLIDEQIDAIYTSTLTRALESAHILASAGNGVIQPLSDFCEMNFGDVEGLTYDEIASRFPDQYERWMDAPTEGRFPNGETFAEMKVRVLKAFETICSQYKDKTVAIVSHAGVNRILIAWALGMPDAHLFRLGQNYGCLNLLAFVIGTPILHSLNQFPSRRHM